MTQTTTNNKFALFDNALITGAHKLCLGGEFYRLGLIKAGGATESAREIANHPNREPYNSLFDVLVDFSRHERVACYGGNFVVIPYTGQEFCDMIYHVLRCANKVPEDFTKLVHHICTLAGYTFVKGDSSKGEFEFAVVTDKRVVLAFEHMNTKRFYLD